MSIGMVLGRSQRSPQRPLNPLRGGRADFRRDLAPIEPTVIISGPQPETVQPRTPARSTLCEAYLGFAVLSAIGGVGSIIFGAFSVNSAAIIGGVIGIVSAVLLFGLSEFFQQVTRITAATEETARLLRERLPK